MQRECVRERLAQFELPKVSTADVADDLREIAECLVAATGVVSGAGPGDERPSEAHGILVVILTRLGELPLGLSQPCRQLVVVVGHRRRVSVSW